MNSPEGKPAVIGFDINFIAERDEEDDAAFAEAAKAHGNVVTGSRVGFSVVQEEQGDSFVTNRMHVDYMEYPYRALREVSFHGFTNTILEEDNYVRRGVLNVDTEEGPEYHFAYEVYKRYLKQKGEEPELPKTDGNGVFGIRYIAPPENYEVFHWNDVVNGVHKPERFRDAIVLVGAYMPGMQDDYNVPFGGGVQMYGVEIHANIVDGLLRGYSYQIVPEWLVNCINLVLCMVYFFLLRKISPVLGVVVGGVLVTGYLAGATWLYSEGWYLFPAAFVLYVICMAAVHVIGRYLLEWFGKRKLLNEFKKYVAPQVLAEMNRSGEFSVKLGGRAET